MPKKPKKQEKLDYLRGYAKYSSMGIQMIIIIGGGVWGGYLLDHLVGWKFPVFIVLCSILSVGMAIYFAVKDL
ncbi:MAG TPA: AtpZ/AtpI family protein [Bacteroidales bacterium]